MSRQSSNRNQRAKGLKLKRAVQVFVLVMVCIWLLHQIKHSHDKKKAMRGEDAISTTSEYSDLETLRLGRKDLISNGVRTNGDDILQDEEKDEAEEEDPRMFKEEADEEDGRVIDGEEIDIHDLIDIDDILKPDEEAGENDDSRSKEEESESLENNDHESAEVNSQGAREEQYERDDPSDAIVENTEDTDAEAEWTIGRNLGEEQMEELGTENGTETSERDINSNITQEVGESAELQGGEIHLSDDHSIGVRALREDRKPEAESLTNSTVDELMEPGKRESNLTAKASSGSNPEHTGDGEAGKSVASMEEELEEKSLTSPITKNASRAFDERDDSLAKDDDALRDEEKKSQTADPFNLPEDQSEMKMV